MKKLFGVQAEFNITADEDIVKGIGKGIANGSVVILDIVKEVKPALIDYLNNFISSKMRATVSNACRARADEDIKKEIK